MSSSPTSTLPHTGNARLNLVLAQLARRFGAEAVAGLDAPGRIGADDRYVVGTVGPDVRRDGAPTVHLHFGVRDLDMCRTAIRAFLDPQVGHLGGYVYSVELLLDLETFTLHLITFDAVDGVDLNAGTLELTVDAPGRADAAPTLRVDVDAEEIWQRWCEVAGVEV